MKKWSVFIYKFETVSETVLFNTMNMGVVAIEKEKYCDISKSLNESSYTSLYSEEQSQLEEMNFIIDSDINEFDDFLDRVIENRNKESILSVVLMPTTDCNFSCHYCIENGYLQPEFP